MSDSLAPHFRRAEFACRCGCGFDTVDAELLQALLRARQDFGAKIRVTSGCRCPAHNRAVGGAKDSRHMQAKAADVQIEGIAPGAVADYFESLYPDRYGIGRYDTWTHFDVRPEKTRWSG